MEAGSDTNANVDVMSMTKSRGRGRDDLLFAQPECSCFGDCPLCFLPLPIDASKHVMLSCCSKVICFGCFHADKLRQRQLKGPEKCPFCRHPAPATHAEDDANAMRRTKANDPVAIRKMGYIHNRKGEYNKAFQYWSKAAELGDTTAHYNLSLMYNEGKGVETDVKKVIRHLEEAAIAGHPSARFNLGLYEWNDGSKERAVKHFIIAANLGEGESLKMLKQCYAEGFVSKEDFAAALRAHQAAVDAMKSPQRDEAYAYLMKS